MHKLGMIRHAQITALCEYPLKTNLTLTYTKKRILKAH